MQSAEDGEIIPSSDVDSQEASYLSGGILFNYGLLQSDFAESKVNSDPQHQKLLRAADSVLLNCNSLSPVIPVIISKHSNVNKTQLLKNARLVKVKDQLQAPACQSLAVVDSVQEHSVDAAKENDRECMPVIPRTDSEETIYVSPKNRANADRNVDMLCSADVFGNLQSGSDKQSLALADGHTSIADDLTKAEKQLNEIKASLDLTSVASVHRSSSGDVISGTLTMLSSVHKQLVAIQQVLRQQTADVIQRLTSASLTGTSCRQPIAVTMSSSSRVQLTEQAKLLTTQQKQLLSLLKLYKLLSSEVKRCQQKQQAQQPSVETGRRRFSDGKAGEVVAAKWSKENTGSKSDLFSSSNASVGSSSTTNANKQRVNDVILQCSPRQAENDQLLFRTRIQSTTSQRATDTVELCGNDKLVTVASFSNNSSHCSTTVLRTFGSLNSDSSIRTTGSVANVSDVVVTKHASETAADGTLVVDIGQTNLDDATDSSSSTRQQKVPSPMLRRSEDLVLHTSTMFRLPVPPSTPSFLSTMFSSSPGQVQQTNRQAGDCVSKQLTKSSAVVKQTVDAAVIGSQTQSRRVIPAADRKEMAVRRTKVSKFYPPVVLSSSAVAAAADMKQARSAAKATLTHPSIAMNLPCTATVTTSMAVPGPPGKVSRVEQVTTTVARDGQKDSDFVLKKRRHFGLKNLLNNKLIEPGRKVLSLKTPKGSVRIANLKPNGRIEDDHGRQYNSASAWCKTVLCLEKVSAASASRKILYNGVPLTAFRKVYMDQQLQNKKDDTNNCEKLDNLNRASGVPTLSLPPPTAAAASPEKLTAESDCVLPRIPVFSRNTVIHLPESCEFRQLPSPGVRHDDIDRLSQHAFFTEIDCWPMHEFDIVNE